MKRKDILKGEYPYVISKTEIVKGDEFEVWSDSQPWVLDKEASLQKLKEYGEKIFKEKRIDLPMEALSFNATSEVVRSGLGLGDSAVILYSDYGLYKDLPLVEIEYSPMAKEYISMRFGEKGINLQAQITDRIDGGLRNLEAYIVGNQSDENLSMAKSFYAEMEEVKRSLLDRLDLQNMKQYYFTEEVKNNLKAHIDSVGAENISAMEAEILATQLYSEELDRKYGTTEEQMKKAEAEIRKKQRVGRSRKRKAD